jgi:type VI secretion system protein ImpB
MNVFAVYAGAIMLKPRKNCAACRAARREIMAKNSNSGQKFISRNRKPRVHITYEDPYDSEELVELPFVMGVLADLSGNASAVEKPEIENRKFLDTDMDNFDARMAAIEPAVAFKTPNKLGGEEGTQLSVNLKFTKFEDFEPAAIARQVPALAKLLAAREQLSNLLRYMDGKVAAEDTLKKLLADPQLMSALKQKLEQRPTVEDKPE